MKVGSDYSTVSADKCTFNTQNKYNGDSNNFGTIVFEDALYCRAELINCFVNATTINGKTSISSLLSTQIGGTAAPRAGTLIVSGSETNIKCGKFVSADNVPDGDYNNTIQISAGKYNRDPSAFIDEKNYEVKKLENDPNGYTYEVVAKAGD